MGKFVSVGSLVLASVCARDSGACAMDAKVKSKPSEWTAYWKQQMRHAKARKIASIDGSSGFPDAKHSPWGGNDPLKWSPEAVLANAASEALNDGARGEDVSDVIVAIPVRMAYGSNRPYGDGQTNAAPSLGDWKEAAPQFVATLIRFDGSDSTVRLRFHRSLAIPSGSVHVSYANAGGEHRDVTLKLKRKSPGDDFTVDWTPEAVDAPVWGDLFSNRGVIVRPDGWSDAFPIDFRDVVKPAAALLAQVPVEQRRLGKGTLLDPEAVSVQGTSGAFAFENMKDPNFGADIHGERYFPAAGNGIHADFGGRVTSVGHGNTLVIRNPFKMAYICFEARNVEAESQFGVPSGGGWHEIGDPAETVMNTLEKDRVLFGYANSRPAAAPAGGGFAYGLADVATFRKLRPGDALVTAAGTTTKSEDDNGWEHRGSGGPEGRNYHWFAFDQSTPVCALEWVHRCVPTADNGWGMACR